MNTSAILDSFNLTFVNILDNIAPVRLKKPKIASQAWLNDNICLLKIICHKAECKWKAIKVSTHLERLKDLMKKHYFEVKAA